MPRPFRPSGLAVALTMAACCAALGPAAIGTALAAAAGTLFEAAPFVLVAEALPAGRLRDLATALGCGCGANVPGALSPVAFALCWLTFGPAVTVARTLAGLAVLMYGRHCRLGRHARTHGPHARELDAPYDAFCELSALAPWAATAALLASSLANVQPAAMRSPTGLAAAVLAGIALGYAAPCGTAAVAIAAAFLAHAPAIAWSVLLVGGIVPRSLAGGLVASNRDARGDTGTVAHGIARPRAFARLALCAAALTVAATGPHGLVNPRLVPLLWLAAALAAVGLRRRTRVRRAALVPAIMLGAIFAGSPPPPYAATETELGDAFPGERLAFTGVVRQSGSATVLERYAISCCRADAAPVAVRLANELRVPNGSWVVAQGTLAASPDGLVLRPVQWQRIGAPADVFVYR